MGRVRTVFKQAGALVGVGIYTVLAAPFWIGKRVVRARRRRREAGKRDRA